MNEEKYNNNNFIQKINYDKNLINNHKIQEKKNTHLNEKIIKNGEKIAKFNEKIDSKNSDEQQKPIYKKINNTKNPSLVIKTRAENEKRIPYEAKVINKNKYIENLNKYDNPHFKTDINVYFQESGLNESTPKKILNKKIINTPLKEKQNIIGEDKPINNKNYELKRKYTNYNIKNNNNNYQNKKSNYNQDFRKSEEYNSKTHNNFFPKDRANNIEKKGINIAQNLNSNYNPLTDMNRKFSRKILASNETNFKNVLPNYNQQNPKEIKEDFKYQNRNNQNGFKSNPSTSHLKNMNEKNLKEKHKYLKINKFII